MDSESDSKSKKLRFAEPSENQNREVPVKNEDAENGFKKPFLPPSGLPKSRKRSLDPIKEEDSNDQERTSKNSSSSASTSASKTNDSPDTNTNNQNGILQVFSFGVATKKPEKAYYLDKAIKSGIIPKFEKYRIASHAKLFSKKQRNKYSEMSKPNRISSKQDRYYSKKFKIKLRKDIKYNFVAKRLQAHSTNRNSSMFDIDYKINDDGDDNFALNKFFDKIKHDSDIDQAEKDRLVSCGLSNRGMSDIIGDTVAGGGMVLNLPTNNDASNGSAWISLEEAVAAKTSFSKNKMEPSVISFDKYIPPKETIKETTRILNECIDNALEDREIYTKKDIENAWLELVSYQDEITIMDPKYLPPEQKITKQIAILGKAIESLGDESLRLKLCQAELYEMHYLFGSETKQIKGIETGLSSLTFYKRLSGENVIKAQAGQSSAFLFAKILLAHLSDSSFSINEHMRFIEKRAHYLQNNNNQAMVTKEQSLELLFYYSLHFLMSAGHTEKAWYLFDSNFNFDLKLPMNDPEAEEKMLEYICKNNENNTTITEAWLTIESLREQAEALPGSFTWDQNRRVDQAFTNSHLRECHYFSRDRELLYRLGLAAMFGRHLFDFDETDIFLKEMQMVMINSMNLEGDLGNSTDMFKARTVDTSVLINCLYPVDGITSMYCLVICHRDLPTKTKKTAKNLIQACNRTQNGVLHSNIILLMYCFLHDGHEKELLVKSLKTINLSASHYNKVLTIIAWAKMYDANFIDDRIVNMVLDKIKEAYRKEHKPFDTFDMIVSLKNMPFPRWMVKEGFMSIFNKLPKMLVDLPKTFRDYVNEERKSFKRITTCTIQEKISVFKLSTSSSLEVYMRCLARLYLENERQAKIKNPKIHFDSNNERIEFDEFMEIGRHTSGYKSKLKRKLEKLLENVGRVSLDVCRCPLLWKLMLHAQTSNQDVKDSHLVGQKFVGWSKSFQMKYLDLIKKSDQGADILLTSIFTCREYGIRLRTLPEECAIYAWSKDR